MREAVPVATRPSPPRLTLIRGATVWTAAGQVLPRADVLLERGKIAAVGQGLKAPSGAVVVDGRGKHLTPGLVDPHSHLGLASLPSLWAHGDHNEAVKPISPDVRAGDAIWPQDPGIALALAGGVTTTLVVPGSSNLIGGQGAIIKLIPGRAASDLLFPGAPPTMKMACGENPKATYKNKGGPRTRMGSVARVRAAFLKAREYRDKWRRFRTGLERWRKKRARCKAGAKGVEEKKEAKRQESQSEKEEELPPKPPERDLAMEALVEILEGRRQIHFHCYRADEMVAHLQLARELGFKIQAFHHAVEAYKIRDHLKRAKTGVVTWVNWWGFKAEALDAIPECPAMLATDGVEVALHSDSPVVAQRLIQEAALAYYRGKAFGLPITEDQAIQLVTRQAARILGIDHLTGSIEKDKMADLVLWDGHPFSVYARTEKVFVDGHLVYDRDGRGRRRTDFELQMVPAASPLPKAAPPRFTLPSWLAGPAPAPIAPQQAAVAARRPVAVVNGVIHPMTGAAPFKGTVLVQAGRVKAVGPAVKVPAGAELIDARGQPVTPGLVAAEVTLGLVEIDLEPSARDHLLRGRRREQDQSIQASLRSWDALNPDSASIPVTRVEGFTTAVVRTYGGLVNGQAAAFDLHGLTPAETALVGPVAVHVELGLRGARVAGSRARALAHLRRLLEDARRFKGARAAVLARRYRKLSAPVEELKAMVPVVERRVPLVVTAHRSADILAALRMAKQERVRLVLSGAAEAWRVARAIAEARVPVLVDVDRNLPSSFDALGGRYDNAARLHRAGVVVALSGQGTSHNVRYLRQLAGIAAAWGLPRDAALAAISSVPASIFGLADRGVLRPGARANLVVWTGDPLELKTRVKHLLIGGERVPLTSRQTQLRDRYRVLP